MARTRIPTLLLALGLCLSPTVARIRSHPDAHHPHHADILAVPRGGGELGPLGARRPATTVPSVKQGSGFSSSTTRQQQKQQQQISAKEAMNSFLTRDLRNTFIARVYTILAVQLLVTAGSIVLFGLHPQLTNSVFRQYGMAVPIISLVLSTVAWIIMSTSVNARRVAPLKWQLLALFTIGEALSVGFVTSFYRFQSVVTTMIATAIATVSVSVYTVKQKNPKYDLSQWGSTISTFGLMFCLYGLCTVLMAAGVLPPNFLPYSDMAYGLIGATLFSFYLAYHTKLIVAGKHAKYQMNEKDYVFGAVTLYNDIINLFVYLLKAIGEEKEH